MATGYRIFVGTVGQGVWRSDDEGRTFQRRSRGMFVECDVRALAAHPTNPSVIYAGTSEGIYRTDDGGDTWQRLDSPMNQQVVWSLLLNPHDANTIYAGSRPACVYRSTDAGRTWQALPAALNRDCANIIFNRVTSLVADPDDRRGLWVGVEIDAVRRSVDEGTTFQRLDTGLSSNDIHGLVIIPEASGRRLLATTNNDLNISRDEGQTWLPQNVGSRFEWSYCRGVAQKADDPQVVFLGNGDGPPGQVGALWRSRDAGRTWDKAKLPCVPNSTIWGFAVHPANARLILSYSVSGEVYRSQDGGEVWDKLPREFGEIRSLLWLP